MQIKFVDDSFTVASFKLKISLTEDPFTRPKPLNYHERLGKILKPEHNTLQTELDKFQAWTEEKQYGCQH